MTPADLRRFDRLVTKTDACWLWHGWTNKGGYGRSYFPDMHGLFYVHRVSYEHFVGPIPEGHHIDHLCRVRNCVRPEHLEPVAPAENIRRGLTGAHHKRKTHCPSGHAYDAENTYVTKNGARKCRACQRARMSPALSDIRKAVR